jgi:tetratricopeptide (TPR) repeat protein
VGAARLTLAAALTLDLAAATAPARAGSAPAPAPDPAGAAAAIAAGDAHYALRDEGARGGTALPFQAEGALADYRRALALDPRSLDARRRFMRAVFFRTGFCGPMEAKDRVRMLDEAKIVAEEAVAALDAETGRRKARVHVDAARAIASAAETYLWAAVSWGQWVVYHRVSGAWQGAPKRIRDLAEAVLSIDPDTTQAGAYIILGRLHSEAPRVPFLTGWVSREKGIACLREGLARAPENQALVYFLADALLRKDPSRPDEARALLHRCVASTPRSGWLVEDAHYADLARARLAEIS